MWLRTLPLAAFLVPAWLFGQVPGTEFDDLAVRLHSAHRDSMVPVDSARFRALVDHLNLKLSHDTLRNWSDADHINLMRSLNTIMFESRPDERFHAGPYAQLEMMTDVADYRKWAAENLGGWVPNRGMGFYFTKLDMELEGTPTLHGRFNVL
jgi:hypothetical protein